MELRAIRPQIHLWLVPNVCYLYNKKLHLNFIALCSVLIALALPVVQNAVPSRFNLFLS